MIFRQLFDSVSSTYTYLLASRRGGEALIIDPVLERVERYVQLLRELDLKLVKAIDTHLHADHITGLGALRDHTRCVTVMGVQSDVDVVSMRVRDGDTINIEGISLTAMYTPGHTDDSYCLRMTDRVFTGDTLLIRGTGRTDFQNGDAGAQYDAIFTGLLKLPKNTLVYPAHDYKGDTVSTIDEERRYNPRLQVSSRAEYVDLMNGLELADPKMMDVAVPANRRVGFCQTGDEARSCAEAQRLLAAGSVLPVDVRDVTERARDGVIPGSVHVAYDHLEHSLKPGGLLRELAHSARRPLLYYCAHGERSALAVLTTREAGWHDCCHLQGGMAAWRKAGGVVAKDLT